MKPHTCKNSPPDVVIKILLRWTWTSQIPALSHTETIAVMARVNLMLLVATDHLRSGSDDQRCSAEPECGYNWTFELQ